MASSVGSLETSANSRPFTFLSQFSTSFTDLLNGDGSDDDAEGPPRFPHLGRGFSGRALAGLTGGGVPKFKSVPPPSLRPISPPPISPSSYFAIPAGLSPAELLDSPVLHPSSQILPSPTTGTIPAQSFNWRVNSGSYQQGIEEEDSGYSDFSFQTQPAQGSTSASTFLLNSSGPKPTEEASRGMQQQQQQQPWNRHESTSRPDGNRLDQGVQREQKNSDDGYNWRKYGQKQVKASENPRSYYKCSFPSCPMKKKVEKNIEGQVTEIVYRGTHNHPKPQSTRRNSSTQLQVHVPAPAKAPEQHSGGRVGMPIDSSATPDNSSVSLGEDDLDMSSHRSRSGGDELDEEEPDAKRWKHEGENEEVSGAGNRAVREPRVVVQTTSDIDILDDGYRWRKYGQKVVKGNPNPRSYYKCTSAGCPVRKHVERASHDMKAVITTYEGKHNHGVPAARGALASRASAENGSVTTMAVRPSPTAGLASRMTASTLFGGGRAPFTLEMLQAPRWDGGLLKAEEEEERDEMFVESVLC